MVAQPADAVTGTAAAPTSIADRDELELIIVTARRRREDIQRTPISVMSLDARELEERSVINLRDLQKFVPNLTFAPSQNVGDAAGNIFIRGIGQEDFVAGTEPGVGFYLDGVYVARTMGALMNLVDIDRIEVLRGPQGTLYGKNSIGGAINVMSVAAGPQRQGYFDLIGGGLGRLDARGMINVSLTDEVFVRVAAGRFSRDGYLKRLPPPFPPTPFTQTNDNDEGRDDRAAGRLQLRWLATPTLTIDLAADASRRRGTQAPTHIDAIDPNFGILPVVNDLIRAGKLPGPEITGALVTDDLLESFAGGPSEIEQDIEGLSATAAWDFGSHDVRLITAYRGLRSHVTTDIDGTWFTILQSEFSEHHRQYSAELQASGLLGGLTYTAGLFALAERMRAQSGPGGRADVRYLCGCFYPPNGRPTLTVPKRKQTGESYAAYVQLGFPLVDRLSATLGGRFSLERKAVDVNLMMLDPDSLEITDLVQRRASNSGRWHSLTWRVGLEFQATPDVMLYASAAKGYKSGGFNTRPVANQPNLGVNQFKPESAMTFEAGIRSEWFHRRLRLNATVFHSSYRDIQLRQQSITDGILTTIIDNAARARIRGLEIEAAARISDRLTANLAYGHLDPRYLDVGSVQNLTLDTDFQRTPRHSLAASFDYSLPLGPHALTMHGDYSYRSREQFQLLPSAFDQKGYGLLAARLTFRGQGDRWSIALFGTNLADKRYRAAGRATGIEDVGSAQSIIGQPRQVGVELRAGL
jgi:iron complex outermembrane receptor protein